MNKDQVEGATKNLVGKVQEQVGKLVGSEEQEGKGISKQISGKVQESVGDVKETVKDISKH